MRLLFICVGNTCRSQMAEAVAKSMGHEAESAGTNPGPEVAREAIRVTGEIDIDMSRCRNLDSMSKVIHTLGRTSGYNDRGQPPAARLHEKSRDAGRRNRPSLAEQPGQEPTSQCAPQKRSAQKRRKRVAEFLEARMKIFHHPDRRCYQILKHS